MSPIDIWKLIDEQRNTDAFKADNSSRKIALSLGCNSKLEQDILNCMRTRPLSDILMTYSVNSNMFYDLIAKYPTARIFLNLHKYLLSAV